ncbi:hypothetical protein F511_31957 [Dorcoceras hygrometricum]|uniref:Uncharacterized protein n=1 Tax=Dorcoceras hygrometricum TaxID=472368 RepID=A0A2Z7DE32_9LAMI|nr:hypothetical protein F511_31957 [Dorcoceras hygrometricum]
MAIDGETEEDADNRREMAMAAVPSLRPNFKPGGGITAAQVSKFRELHKRRLQIKAKSKANKRGKGEFQRKKSEAKECSVEEEPRNDVGGSSTAPILKDSLSIEEDNISGNLVAKRRRKLHWG